MMVMVMPMRHLVGNHRWRRRRLLDHICSVLRACWLFIVGARDPCGTRRRATSFAMNDAGRDRVVILLLDSNKAHCAVVVGRM